MLSLNYRVDVLGNRSNGDATHMCRIWSSEANSLTAMLKHRRHIKLHEKEGRLLILVCLLA